MSNIAENYETQQSILTYLRNRVTPILEPLQFDILIHKPTDVYEFAYQWLKNYQKSQDINFENKFFNSDDEKEQQLDPELENQKLIIAQKIRLGKKRRKGISGETSSNFKQQQLIKSYSNKCEEDRIKIFVQLRNSILFKNISERNIGVIIDCMEIRQYKPNQVVIKQGDYGQQLYLVDTGTFKCEISGKDKVQKIYESGEIFGELSLLYNSKRASTITAVNDGKLFVLDRKIFNTIIRDDVLKKNRLCQQILMKNKLFSTMNQYQRSKIVEVLKQFNITAGKYVIKEGQIGDRFYIVCEGNLVAEKQMQNGDIGSVEYYKEGDYFGEIALIRNVPRQASVKALTSSKLLYIERSVFKRLLCPLEQILKRNENKYQK